MSPSRTETRTQASTIAKIAVAYPDRAAADLHEMIAHALTARPTTRPGEHDLGLVIEILEEAGDLPQRGDYRLRRRAENSNGANWPSAAQLESKYGPWNRVTSAALYVAEDRADRHVRRTDDGRIAIDSGRRYTRDEIKDAVIRCYDAIGAWPTPEEYNEYRNNSRRQALLVDSRSPKRFPHRDAIRKRFDSWDRLIYLAKKKHASRF